MLKNIQTLRFVAALWVVIHHLQPPVTPFRMTVLPVSVSELGFAGVDNARCESRLAFLASILDSTLWSHLYRLVASFHGLLLYDGNQTGN